MATTPLQRYRSTRERLDLLTALIDAPSAEDARLLLDRMKRLIGFDYLDFGVIDERAAPPEMRLDVHDVAIRKATDEYKDRALDKDDPMARRLMDASHTLFAIDEFSRADRSRNPGSTRAILNLFRRHRIAAHAAMPIRQANAGGLGFLFAGITDADKQSGFNASIRNEHAYLNLAATAFFAKAGAKARAVGADLLSRAEAEVLRHLADGLTQPEIAAVTGKSLSTLRNQVASAKARLGARTAAQAIVIAIDLGVIRKP